VLGDSLRLVLIGAALGLVVAFWVAGFVEQRLYGITPTTRSASLAGVIVLAAVALVAAWAPAYRAARVDPIQALRTE
jgi:ABC-type antimicrobial peptide transport system permease subunit